MSTPRQAVGLFARGITIVAMGGLLGTWPGHAQEAYPTRDVRVIVPFSAGGGTDLVTRLFAQKLGEKLGKAFYVENKASGRGGSVGSLELARSKPDGYTIGSGTSSGIQSAAIDPSDFNPLRDLDPIARYGATTLVVAINPRVPAKTMKEFVAFAKANPELPYASSGVGSATHIAGERLASDAGISLNHIPYRGEGTAIKDVLSGEVSLLFVSLAAGKPYVESGALRALAITSAKRSPALPDVPTMSEAGFDDFVMDAWYGLYVPKGTPPKVVELLVKQVNEIRSDPAVSARLMELLSFDTSGEDNPATFRAYMAQELERYSAIVKEIGLKKE